MRWWPRRSAKLNDATAQLRSRFRTRLPCGYLAQADLATSNPPEMIKPPCETPGRARSLLVRIPPGAQKIRIVVTIRIVGCSGRGGPFFSVR